MTLLVGSIFHMTRKIVSEMTYNVSMGTLNHTIPYHTIPYDISAAVSECSVIVGFNDDGGSITVQWLDVVLRVSIGCVIVLYHVVIDTKDN